MKILMFPNLRQAYEYDCGANVTQSILDYYGIDAKESEIIKIAGTTRVGTSIKGIIKTLKKFGLKTKKGELTINQIKQYIDKKIPVILVIQAWTENKKVNWEKDWKDGHYVVVIGYDKHKFYFEDPASELRTYLTYKELDKRWHDMDVKRKKYVHFGIAVYGKKPAYSFKKKIHME
ncbi:MAG: cysteine peptidase family C39 domain-containing protein [Nanoarchaeota archaeon]